MTLYELTKKYSSGKGENAMWATLDIVSQTLEDHMNEKEKGRLLRKVYSIISSGHYNEDFAKEDVAKMYYTDKNGEKHHAPYWSESDLKSLYESRADKIRDYNFWDFYVAMNMIASDNWCILYKWFPGISDAEMNEKITEMAVAWLRDDDWPTTTKVWDYINHSS